MNFERLLEMATLSWKPSAEIARDRLHLILHDDRCATRPHTQVGGFTCTGTFTRIPPRSVTIPREAMGSFYVPRHD